MVRNIIVVLVAVMCMSSIAFSANLVAYYPFDGDTLDYAGTVNGTKTDAVVYTNDRYCNAGNAIQHTSRSAARVEFGNQSVFNNIGNDFTITFWVRIETGNGGNIVNHDLEGTSSTDWILGVFDSGTKKGCVYFSFGNPAISGNTAIDDGAWHHVAVRRNRTAGSFAIFIDGVLDFSVTGDTYTVPGDPRIINLHQDLTASTTTQIGPYKLSGSWASGGFLGKLDDLRFYSGQLSDAEVAALAPILLVKSPNGYETIKAGTETLIEWETISPCDLPMVTLEYSSNGGNNWQLIAEVSNTGSYTWEAPAVLSNQYLVRVTDTSSGKYDTSDAFFTIYDCTTALTGDLNADCLVDLMDFALLASNWLGCGFEPSSMCP